MILSLTLFQQVYQIVCIFAPCFENLQLSQISDYVWNEPLLLPNNQLFRLYHPLYWAKLPIFIEYDLLFRCKTKNVLGKHRKTRNFVLKYLRQKFPSKLKVYIASKLPLHFFQSVPHFPTHFFSATPITLFDLSCCHWSVMFAFVTQRNSGKFLDNGSMKVRQFPFQIFFISLEPPGPADKILHRLHYLQVKTGQTCHARSRNPLTERLKTQLHSVNRHDSPEYFMWNCVSPLFSFKGLPLPINPALWCQAGGFWAGK